MFGMEMITGMPAARMRPPWMAEVPETQEQFSGRPPWMAEVPETQEQFSGRA